MKRAHLLVAVLSLGACTPGELIGMRDTGLEGLALTRIDPGLILPGTLIVATGQSFVGESLGSTRIRLHGTLRAADFDKAFDVTVVSGGRLELEANASFVSAFGSRLDGVFEGEATVETFSKVDFQLHASKPLAVTLTLADESTPSLDGVGDGVSFVNQPIQVTGGGFLLGGAEGETRAVLSGCFTPVGQSACGANTEIEVPARPAAPYERTRAVFPYATSVSGIGSGSFAGTLALKNVHTSGRSQSTTPRAVRFDVQRPAIFGASTTSASVGQYVVIQGGGFVGGESDEATLLEIKGRITVDDSGDVRPLDVQLVAEFVSGPVIRYILADSDPIGTVINLREESGTIEGYAKPIVVKGAARVEGDAIPVRLGIQRVKQVVHINFLPSYVDSLRHFGLRAADPLIRKRVHDVAGRDYEGVNIEFREARPDDFALYSIVELAGPDPNGQGLLGYDNTPGKDTDNKRLYDKIGGVNAVTQEDGSPGYGGVFVESFFGFSNHPNGLAQQLPETSADFDKIFDPFRPDQGGSELTAGEIARLSPPELVDGSECPARDRATQIACAVWVLGNMIGSTMTHEVGHSLGLANPYGSGYHDVGDVPNRLMEVGSARPFNERAQLHTEGPSMFCDTWYEYLVKILKKPTTPPLVPRPSCE